ncbi:hypothetical protein ACS0TY_022261 [Phlomoides rotata]
MKRNNHQQAALMVLMISAKSACQIGWFSTEDSGELINLANKIASNVETDLNTEPSQTSLSVISAIMSRYYPRMKMDHNLGFLEVKSGNHVYARDFQMSKDLRRSPGDKTRLFVVRLDNIETSSCLVTPGRVDFFLNGMQVCGRNSLFLDSGPQLPTDITPLLRDDGKSNLLQALGDFNGNYIVAVASMSELPNPDSASLQDYEHAPATVDADCEVTEGPSVISLNCPISMGRIKIPVKGRSCNHITCFDFYNYVEINSTRPNWRCPSCNKPTSFSDIRLDQNMVKVLKKVNPNVMTIIFYPNGSWGPMIEIEDTVEKLEHMPSNNVQDVVDLTEDDDDRLMNTVQLSGQITTQHVVDLTKDDDDDFMNDVQPSGQSSNVSASLLLTYQNRGVEARDQSGTNVASSSQTVGDDVGLMYSPGRMRGSLSGQAYVEYHYQTIILPMQQAEATRSMLGITPPVQPQFIAGGIVRRNPAPTTLTQHRFGRPSTTNFPSSSNSSGMQ